MAKKDYSTALSNLGRGDKAKAAAKPNTVVINEVDDDEEKEDYLQRIILVSDINENPDNTFKVPDDHFQEELVNSIRLHGLMDPLVVIKDKSNPRKYILYSGHRRFKALKTLGIKSADAKVYAEIKEKSAEIAALCSYNLGYRGDDPFGMAMNALKYNFEESKKPEAERVSYKDATGITDTTGRRIEQLAKLRYEVLKIGQDGYFTRDDAIAFINAKSNDKERFLAIQDEMIDVYNSDLDKDVKAAEIKKLIQFSGKKIAKKDEQAVIRNDALKLGRAIKKASVKIGSVNIDALTPKAKADLKKLVEEARKNIDALLNEL